MAKTAGATRAPKAAKPATLDPDEPLHGEGHNGAEKGKNDDLVMQYVARMDAQDGVIAGHEAALKAARKQLGNIRNSFKGTGGKLKNLDAARKKRDMPRHEQRDDLEEIDHYDVLLGNVTWQESSLFDKAPEPAKDEIEWEATGYAAGKRGLAAKLPEGIPPMMDQHYLRGHDRGTEELFRALGGKAKPDPEPPVPVVLPEGPKVLAPKRPAPGEAPPAAEPEGEEEEAGDGETVQ